MSHSRVRGQREIEVPLDLLQDLSQRYNSEVLRGFLLRYDPVAVHDEVFNSDIVEYLGEVCIEDQEGNAVVVDDVRTKPIRNKVVLRWLRVASITVLLHWVVIALYSYFAYRTAVDEWLHELQDFTTIDLCIEKASPFSFSRATGYLSVVVSVLPCIVELFLFIRLHSSTGSMLRERLRLINALKLLYGIATRLATTLSISVLALLLCTGSAFAKLWIVCAVSNVFIFSALPQLFSAAQGLIPLSWGLQRAIAQQMSVKGITLMGLSSRPDTPAPARLGNLDRRTMFPPLNADFSRAVSSNRTPSVVTLCSLTGRFDMLVLHEALRDIACPLGTHEMLYNSLLARVLGSLVCNHVMSLFASALAYCQYSSSGMILTTFALQLYIVVVDFLTLMPGTIGRTPNMQDNEQMRDLHPHSESSNSEADSDDFENIELQRHEYSDL